MLSDLIWLSKNGKANYDPKWRKIYLLHASDPFNPISTTTHNNDYHGIMNAGKRGTLLVRDKTPAPLRPEPPAKGVYTFGG